MKRRERSWKHSLSCTDDEWERISARASRRGQSASAFIVECALAVDPAGPGMRWVAREEMTAILEAIVRIEERVFGLPVDRRSVLESLAERVAFLIRRVMTEMIREGREEDLVDLLAMKFGKTEAMAKAEAFRKFMERGKSPS